MGQAQQGGGRWSTQARDRGAAGEHRGAVSGGQVQHREVRIDRGSGDSVAEGVRHARGARP